MQPLCTLCLRGKKTEVTVPPLVLNGSSPWGNMYGLKAPSFSNPLSLYKHCIYEPFPTKNDIRFSITIKTKQQQGMDAGAQGGVFTK